MTENGKKFLEQASKDAALQSELQAAQSRALHALLKDKGLEDEAKRAANEVTLKIASAHGFALTAEDLNFDDLKALSEDELKAVAGGSVNMGSNPGWCACFAGGIGAGKGLKCGCVGTGAGAGGGGGCGCWGPGGGKV